MIFHIKEGIMKSKLYLFIGEKIRKHRKNNGLTQEELANEIGLSRASIVQIEQGKQKISIHILYKVANIFNKPITDFILWVLKGKP